MDSLIVQVAEKEALQLELAGARARLAKVLSELELHRGRKDRDDHEYSWLLVEHDEATKISCAAAKG